jgi:hypothetical protein
MIAGIFVSALIGIRLLRKRRPGRNCAFETVLAAVAIGIAGLFYSPLTVGTAIGQIQTLLTLGFAVALYCWLTGREAAGGAAIGLMVLVKPQYVLFLVWAVLRRRYSAALAASGCLVVGTLAACATFGLHNNLEYVAVLQFIGRRGEAYFANQSANGLLNHLMGNGILLSFDPKNFAPYNPVAFYGTMASSLLLVMLALFFPWGKERRGGAADLACMVLVSTMASPIAWNHHYGILLPIFVWLWFSEYAWKKTGWATILLAFAYISSSNIFAVPASILASTALVNFAASGLYFSSILTLVLLLRSRAVTRHLSSPARDRFLSPALRESAP